jgi:hypothetical protein
VELFQYFPSLPSSHVRDSFVFLQMLKMEGKIRVVGLTVNSVNMVFNTTLSNLVDIAFRKELTLPSSGQVIQPPDDVEGDSGNKMPELEQ